MKFEILGLAFTHLGREKALWELHASVLPKNTTQWARQRCLIRNRADQPQGHNTFTNESCFYCSTDFLLFSLQRRILPRQTRKSRNQKQKRPRRYWEFFLHFCWRIFVLGQLWKSEHICDGFMLSPQSDIDERQRVLRWACLIYLFCCHVICSGKRKSNIAL